MSKTVTKKDVIHSENFDLKDNGRLIVIDTKPVPLLNSLIQWTRKPLSEDARWFKITLLTDLKEEQYIMFGTSPKCSEQPPSWNRQKSLRYNSDTGGVFVDGEGKHSDNRFGKGDSVVCYLEKNFSKKCILNLFLNGILVYRQWIKVPQSDLYPTVGINQGPAEITVQWPDPSLLDSEIPLQMDHLRSWVGYRNIKKDNTARTLELAELDAVPRLGYSIQSPRPLDKACSYFEVEILSRSNPDIGQTIGLTSSWHDKHSHPGWLTNTIGYHSDDGGVLHENGTGYLVQGETYKCNVGDKMGCGVCFSQKNDGKKLREKILVMVYFSKNDRVFFKRVVMQPDGGFYPCVGFNRKGDKVKVIHPCDPPSLTIDIEKELNVFRPLYKDFRFAQSITFPQYKTVGDSFVKLFSKDEGPRLVQCMKEALSKDRPYFEVEVVGLSTKTVIQIGVAAKDFPLEQQSLGWNTNSCAIRVEKAMVLLPKNIFFTKNRLGDKIGVYLWESRQTESVILFLVNGCPAGRVTVSHSTRDQLYPSISMEKGPLELKVLWPNAKQLKDKKLLLSLFDISQWTHFHFFKTLGTEFSLEKFPPGISRACILGPCPVKRAEVFYFETKLIRSKDKVMPGIGVTSESCRLDLEAGSNKFSAVLYPTNGVFITNLKGKMETSVIEELKGTIIVGDIVGCRISACFSGKEDMFNVEFMKNGKPVKFVQALVPLGGLYPVICFTSTGSVIEVDIRDKLPDLVTETTHLTSIIDEDTMYLDDDLSNIYDGTDYELMELLKHHQPMPVYTVVGQNSDPLSTRTNIYLCHSYADIPDVQPVFTELLSKGYEVHMSSWNVSKQQMILNMKKSHGGVIFLSKGACRDEDFAFEVNCIRLKGLHYIAVKLDDMTWPPTDRLEAFQEMFSSVNCYSLDFAGKEIIGSELEQYLKEAIERGEKERKELFSPEAERPESVFTPGPTPAPPPPPSLSQLGHVFDAQKGKSISPMPPTPAPPAPPTPLEPDRHNKIQTKDTDQKPVVKHPPTRKTSTSKDGPRPSITSRDEPGPSALKTLIKPKENQSKPNENQSPPKPGAAVSKQTGNITKPKDDTAGTTNAKKKTQDIPKIEVIKSEDRNFDDNTNKTDQNVNSTNRLEQRHPQTDSTVLVNGQTTQEASSACAIL